LIPEGETANSVRFVLPTICTLRCGHCQTWRIGLRRLVRLLEKLRTGVVIDSFHVDLFFTASRSRLLFASPPAFNESAVAGELLVDRGVNEHR